MQSRASGHGTLNRGVLLPNPLPAPRTGPLGHRRLRSVLEAPRGWAAKAVNRPPGASPPPSRPHGSRSISNDFRRDRQGGTRTGRASRRAAQLPGREWAVGTQHDALWASPGLALFCVCRDSADRSSPGCALAASSLPLQAGLTPTNGPFRIDGTLTDLPVWGNKGVMRGGHGRPDGWAGLMEKRCISRTSAPSPTGR